MYREGAALAGIARDGDLSTIRPDQRLAHGESQADAFRLRREQRLKDFFERRGLDARTGILDRDPYIPVQPAGTDGKAPTLRHGLNRVRYQICQHLPDL